MRLKLCKNLRTMRLGQNLLVLIKKKACIGESKSVKFIRCDAGVWLSFTANTVLPGSIGHDSPELCKN